MSVTNNGDLDFWQRLDMYTEAIGVKNVKTAWELASVPVSADDHRAIAKVLVGDGGQSQADAEATTYDDPTMQEQMPVEPVEAAPALGGEVA